jgi:hypothetical protein
MLRGTGESQFVGTQITPLAIEVRGYAVSADSYNVMRVSLFQWARSVTPVTIADVYQYPGTVSSPLTFNNKENIITLRDEYFPIDPNTGYTFVWKWYIKKKNIIPIQFDGTGGQASGALYVTAMSDSANLLWF